MPGPLRGIDSHCCSHTHIPLSCLIGFTEGTYKSLVAYSCSCMTSLWSFYQRACQRRPVSRSVHTSLVGSIDWLIDWARFNVPLNTG